MRRMHFIILTIMLWAGLAACAAPAAAPATPPLTSDSLRIEGAWARPSIVPNGNSAIYLTIVNPTDHPDRLVAVKSPAGMAETHESVTENNIVRMEPRPNGFEIPARSTVLLLPGGKHIMLMGVGEPLASGDAITATLVFASMGEVTVTVPIKDAQ